MTEWLALTADPGSPREARAFVTNWLQDWGYRPLVESAALVVSELASNSVRHAGQSFTVGVEDLGHGIRVCVQDPVAAPPLPRPATSSDVDGRGMHIVDALTDSWGTQQIPDDGKVVWCTLEATADRATV